MKIGIDISGLDASIHKYTGQYRYAVDLIRGLSQLEVAASSQFIILGSGPTPWPEIMDVFRKGKAWCYCESSKRRYPGKHYVDSFKNDWLIQYFGIQVWHVVHGYVPFFSCGKTVVTVYDLMPEIFEEYRAIRASREYRFERWKITRLNPHLVAISETTARDLTRLWGISSRRIAVVPLGSHFKYMEQGKPEELMVQSVRKCLGPVLLSPFNLEPRKNMLALIRAMPKICSQFPEATLILFGNTAWSPDREAVLVEEIKKQNLERQILHFLKVSDDDLKFLYRSANIFVYPSLYEGYGLPVLEAMQAGMPVIVKKQTAMEEVTGDAACLIENNDSETLARSVIDLLKNVEMRQRLSDEGRCRAQAYTIQAMALNTWKVYSMIEK